MSEATHCRDDLASNHSDMQKAFAINLYFEIYQWWWTSFTHCMHVPVWADDWVKKAGGCEGVSRDLRQITGLGGNSRTFVLFPHHIYSSDCYKKVFVFTCCLPKCLMPASLYFDSSYQEGQRWFPQMCCHHLLSPKIVCKAFEIWLVKISVLTSLNCCFVIKPFWE